LGVIGLRNRSLLAISFAKTSSSSSVQIFSLSRNQGTVVVWLGQTDVPWGDLR